MALPCPESAALTKSPRPQSHSSTFEERRLKLPSDKIFLGLRMMRSAGVPQSRREIGRFVLTSHPVGAHVTPWLLVQPWATFFSVLVLLGVVCSDLASSCRVESR